MEEKFDNEELIKENIEKDFNFTEFDLKLLERVEEVAKRYDELFRRLAK